MIDPADLKAIRDDIKDTQTKGDSLTASQLRQEYTALANRNKTLILKFSRRTQITLAVLTVILLILGVASLKLTSDIQNSRVQQCEMGNEHHINTEIELEKTIRELPPDLHKQAIAQKKNTERLLNAVAPLRDCSKI